MVLHNLGKYGIWQMPDFVHPCREPHTYKGSLLRHIVVENVLFRIRHWLTDRDALPGYSLLNALMSILFGFNCNFPAKDIALYTSWYFRGCKPVAVFKPNHNCL